MHEEPAALAAASTTSAQTLRELAIQHPALRSIIVQNPNCYPELAEWISQQQPVPGYSDAGQPATFPEQEQAAPNSATPSGGGRNLLIGILVGAAAMAIVVGAIWLATARMPPGTGQDSVTGSGTEELRTEEPYEVEEEAATELQADSAPIEVDDSSAPNMSDCDEVGMLCVQGDGTFPGVYDGDTYTSDVGLNGSYELYVYYERRNDDPNIYAIRLCFEANPRCTIPLNTLDGQVWYLDATTVVEKISASQISFVQDGTTIVFDRLN